MEILMRNSIRNLTLVAPLLALTLAGTVRAQDMGQPPPGGAPPPAAEPPPVASAAAPQGNITGPPLGGPTVWLMLNWNGVGAGGRYMFPLGIPSLLKRTPFKDSWALEAGVDLFHISSDYYYGSYTYNELIPTVGVMWLVWLREDFAVYPKVDAGWQFGFGSNANSLCGSACDLGGIWVEGAAGLLYKVGGGITLRAELGNYGIKGGVAWLF
jgi:hypothetical protein